METAAFTSNTAGPLVSCVMATTQTRRIFLPQALRCFQRQTHEPRELIVVDDPGEPAALPPGIRYLQAESCLPIGSKLNLGIRHARGEIIQKLDDDDYYHPEFLAATVGALCAANDIGSIVACESCLLLISTHGDLRYRSGGMFAGGTFCFFQELWRRRPFRDLAVGEDQTFLSDHQPRRIGLRNPELYMYVRHSYGHLWDRFLQSAMKRDGPVSAGDSVTEYLHRQPAYHRTLRECVPAEDFAFYQSLVATAESTSPRRVMAPSRRDPGLGT